MSRLWWVLVGVLLLAACTPTGPADDATPNVEYRYIHPGGLFSLNLPPSWSAGDLSAGAALLVTFSPPGEVNPPLTVYAVRLPAELDAAGLQAATDEYLAAAHNATLTVLDREIMSDGSWRVRGVRQRGEDALPVNVFVQRDGAVFSALEVVVPPYSDAYNTALLQVVVNSYRVDETLEWALWSVDAVPEQPPEFVTAVGNLAFDGLRTWTDGQGRFLISGRIANRTAYPVQDVQIRATLLDDAGNIIAEQVGAAPGRILMDGEFAPFTVRFDGGRPPAAARYALQADADQADLVTYYGPIAFDWEDHAVYDDAGGLHIQGTIWNIGDATAAEVEAIVTFFDGADRVVGYVAGTVSEAPLPAGGSVRFDLNVPALDLEPARYLLAIQAQRQ
ncbi:MAG: hypothetical protein JW910_14940 [Anaerolineae bacterium]|nr:hypothetical protein [Anaerolineae bacterium]